MKMLTKKELLKSPVRKWDTTDTKYHSVLIVPAGTKHDSGFMHIAIIGVLGNWENPTFEICGYPDDISYLFGSSLVEGLGNFSNVRMDCFYPQGILRFHCRRGHFEVSAALSSMDVTFIKD